MIYLASPYSHKSVSIKESRYLFAMKCTAALIKKKLFVWSPIVHCHEMAKRHGMPDDAAFWMEYNFDFIRHSQAVYVLALYGWKESVGVKEEIDVAKKLFIPVRYVDINGEDVGVE